MISSFQSRSRSDDNAAASVRYDASFAPYRIIATVTRRTGAVSVGMRKLRVDAPANASTSMNGASSSCGASPDLALRTAGISAGLRNTIRSAVRMASRARA